INAFWNFAQNPRPGEVYNLGGGRENAASLLECIEMIAQASGGKRPALTYTETNRIGDHICYYSDLRKFKQHYPSWSLSYSLPRIVEEMVRLISDNPAEPERHRDSDRSVDRSDLPHPRQRRRSAGAHDA